MASPIIVAEGLTKSYRGRPAVEDLTFDVYEGEIFGFLGPNGAGKSTTMRLLLGLTAPDRGRARVAGLTVGRDDKAIHRLCGVAFEISNLYERLTAFENLAFFARLAGCSEKDVHWVLDAVGLASRAHDGVHTFSRGMRQRLILARAMLHRPRILFLDEPTAGLDPNAAQDIRALIDTFCRRDGVTVFLTTHDMAEAETLCHRVGIIDRGRLIALDTVSALKERHGRAEVALIPAGADPSEARLYPADSPAWIDAAADYQRRGIPFRIHSQEASLAQVFYALTGRPGGTGAAAGGTGGPTGDGAAGSPNAPAPTRSPTPAPPPPS